MTRKELMEDISIMQQKLGMKLLDLKALMVAETGCKEIKSMTVEDLAHVKELLLTKAKNEKAGVDVKDTHAGAEVTGSGAATVTVLVITNEKTLRRAISALAAAVESGAEEAK